MDWLQLFGTLTLIRCTRPLSVNIAGGKPTYQSSTLVGAVSSRAVDGNRNTHFVGDSCTHTNQNNNPWWVVDLQWSRIVESVNLTNRGDYDAMGWRLSNVRIGTTDVSPDVTAPTPTNFAICASQDPAVGEGATQQFTCGGQGRYLVVLLEGTKYLTLCEVEVYASKRSMPWLLFGPTLNSRLVGHEIETSEVEAKTWCSLKCRMNPECSSFNLRLVTSGSMTCELIGDITAEDITIGLTADSKYAFYRIE